jgi:hypothetical protein
LLTWVWRFSPAFLVAALIASALLLLPSQTEPALAQVPVDSGKCRKSQLSRACRTAEPELQSLLLTSEAQPEQAVSPAQQMRVHDILDTDGTKVGLIYVDRPSNASRQYVEHWVMFDNYFYPSRISPSEEEYGSAEDFLARAPWGPGYTYVRWDAAEQSSLPGR